MFTICIVSSLSYPESLLFMFKYPRSLCIGWISPGYDKGNQEIPATVKAMSYCGEGDQFHLVFPLIFYHSSFVSSLPRAEPSHSHQVTLGREEKCCSASLPSSASTLHLFPCIPFIVMLLLFVLPCASSGSYCRVVFVLFSWRAMRRITTQYNVISNDLFY